MRPLVFYFPYPEVGGVSVLFLRLAERLKKVTSVTLVDLPEGYMARNCPSGVRILGVDDLSLIDPNGILVTQSCPPWRLTRLDTAPRSLRVFFWNLHPDNIGAELISARTGHWLARFLKPISPLLSLARKRRLRRFLAVALEHQAIAFMDAMNAERTAVSLAAQFSPVYLPICTGDSVGVKRHQARNVIDCVWLGRIEGFKTPVLLHTMDRLDAIDNLRVRLTIIGDGADMQLVRNAASELRRLECILAGSLPLSEVDSVLPQYDITFAMGTSALEAAKLGIPTFCLDYSYGHISGLLRFRLIDKVRGFNLAEEITSQHLECASTLESQLNAIMQNPERIGKRCFDYWNHHHSPDKVAAAFCTLASQSRLTVGQLQDLGLTVPDILTKYKSLVYEPHPIKGWSYF